MYLNARTKGVKNALPVNSTQEIYAGLLMGQCAAAKSIARGKKKWMNVKNVKFLTSFLRIWTSKESNNNE